MSSYLSKAANCGFSGMLKPEEDVDENSATRKRLADVTIARQRLREEKRQKLQQLSDSDIQDELLYWKVKEQEKRDQAWKDEVRQRERNHIQLEMRQQLDEEIKSHDALNRHMIDVLSKTVCC